MTTTNQIFKALTSLSAFMDNGKANLNKVGKLPTLFILKYFDSFSRIPTVEVCDATTASPTEFLSPALKSPSTSHHLFKSQSKFLLKINPLQTPTQKYLPKSLAIHPHFPYLCDPFSFHLDGGD